MTQDHNTDHRQEHFPSVFAQTFFHGTKAHLTIGDFIRPGFQSNYLDKKLRHVYVAATLHPAILGAELALGTGPGRIYLVEATGPIQDDPNVTDKKFPGNPTLSFRSEHPFKVVGEVTVWPRHSDVQLQAIKEGLEKMKMAGQQIIID